MADRESDHLANAMKIMHRMAKTKTARGSLKATVIARR
jgi:hypothetical protein